MSHLAEFETSPPIFRHMLFECLDLSQSVQTKLVCCGAEFLCRFSCCWLAAAVLKTGLGYPSSDPSGYCDPWPHPHGFACACPWKRTFLHICQNFMANARFNTPNKSLDLLLWSSYQWGGESGELVKANLVLLYGHRPFQSCSNSVNLWTHMWSRMNFLQKALLNASHTTSSAIAT